MAWLLPQLPPTFEAALRDAGAKRADARIEAGKRLAYPDDARDAEARDALARLARDPVPGVRAAAVRSLGHVGGALDTLAQCVEDEDARVRELAVISLASAGEAARDALHEALDSRHPEVRFQAALSYAEVAPAHGPSAILPLLEDVDAEVRANAARALGASSGPESDAALTRALEDSATRVRQEAALALAERGAKTSTKALCEALSDPQLVLDALEALGAPEHGSAGGRVALLADALLRPLPVKAAAARALVRMGDPRGPVALRRVLRAWRADGRSYAVATIGELGLAEFAPALAGFVDRPRGVDPETVAKALKALANSSETAREALQRMAARSDAAGQQARQVLGTEPSA